MWPILQGGLAREANKAWLGKLVCLTKGSTVYLPQKKKYSSNDKSKLEQRGVKEAAIQT